MSDNPRRAWRRRQITRWVVAALDMIGVTSVVVAGFVISLWVGLLALGVAALTVAWLLERDGTS